MILHFMPAPDAAKITAAYISALVPGSHMIITIGRGDEQVGDRVTAAYDAASLFNHTPEEVGPARPGNRSRPAPHRPPARATRGMVPSYQPRHVSVSPRSGMARRTLPRSA